MSQWNNISEALNCRRQADTLLFCSISMERSRKTSSRVVMFSQVRHFVSDVNIPSNNSWTQRALLMVSGERLFSYRSTDSTTSLRR